MRQRVASIPFILLALAGLAVAASGGLGASSAVGFSLLAGAAASVGGLRFNARRTEDYGMSGRLRCVYTFYSGKGQENRLLAVFNSTNDRLCLVEKQEGIT